MTTVHLRSGHPHPLGATWDGQGVNFALFSRHATRVELCLFPEATALREAVAIPLSCRTDDIWHVYVHGLRPGQLYGYRVYGPYQPSEGHRFNGSKILLDPYAKAIGRETRWGNSLFGYQIGHPQEDLSLDLQDSAPHAPLAAVVDERFSWGNDRPPRIPWERTVIYETHVKGQTQLHPDIAPRYRGTYLGLCSSPMLRHYRQLGVTAIELLPVQYSLDDRHLAEKQLRNYWGYSPLAYFAPHPRYRSSSDTASAVVEFKTMVKELHRAGLEVLLDVVYNHTCEGSRWGPTLSWRGIDNLVYYRLERRDRRHYTDFSGCGNCLEVRQPYVLKMIADSLRYWVQEMHVDGFRFDLAPVMGRDHHAFNRLSAFFQILQQDPVLSQVKLIAEPWDLGDQGYQVGNFPPPWREWNGKYRDNVRDFWRGDSMAKGEFATRLCGSQDLYPRERRPLGSINFITCHDGFSLRDLVSYNEKHNHANGEENRDGDSHNRSWNCGIEGPTDLPEVNQLRERQMRNFLATLLLSQGVPMIRAGDEFGQTQQGNNNAYCQDNEVSWLDWHHESWQTHLLRFTRQLAQLRRELIQGNLLIRYVWDLATAPSEIQWVRQDGKPMLESDWHDGRAQVGVLMSASRPLASISQQDLIALPNDRFIVFNAHHEPLRVELPEPTAGYRWLRMMDTSLDGGKAHACSELHYPMEPRSLAVFCLRRDWALWRSRGRSLFSSGQ